MRACAACGQPVPIRWRNDLNAPKEPDVEHIAGPIISSVEPRPSCPHYVVDRRQACTRCGKQLVRGRWAAFWVPGQLVLEHVYAGIMHTLIDASQPTPVSCRR